MPLNADVMEVVRILDEEGFGALAGELLMEISLGRELDVDAKHGTETPKAGASDGDDFDPDERPRREPIPDDKQLGEAVHFLRLRLVEPMRHLAEAERIAGELSHDISRGQDQGGTYVGRSRPATRIAFVDYNGDTVTDFARTEPAGEGPSAEDLDKVLTRIAARAV